MLAAPVAAGDFFYVAKNSQLAVGAPGLLVNDFDADGDAITATAYSAATAGTVAGQSNGSFTYLPPNATYQGTATFTYRARDALTQSAQVTVAIDVGDVAGDTASNARTVTVAAGQKIELAGRIGDSTTGARDIDLFQLPLAAGQTIVADVDAKSLDRGGTLGNFDGYLRLFNSTTEVASNDNGVDPDTGVSSIDPVVRFTAVTSGTYYVGVSGTGNRNYSPTQPNSGMPSVTGDYRLQISVINNTRPDAVDDSIATTAGTKISIPVLINDTDPQSDLLKIDRVTNPSHGSLFWQQLVAGGAYTFDYTPAAGFFGTDSFSYTIKDPGGLTDTATVSVRVGNRAPIPIDDSYFAVAGELRVFSSPGVLGNDADPDGDPISAVLATAASHGTVSLNANGSFTYSAASGYSGSDSFTYRVNDGLATSNVATVRLTVYPTDNSVTNDEYSIPHDHPLTVGTASGVLINDWDLEGDSLSAQLVSGPAHGGLSFASNGAFVYTPSAGFAGVDSFQYRATDGTHVTNVGTVTLRVLNRSPDSSDDVFTFMHDTSLTVAVPGVLGGDADFDHDNLSAILLSNPQHGALAFNASGGFTYIPAAGFSGIDSFTYRATDGIDVSRTATVTLRVNRFAPVTSDDSIPISAGRTALLSAADLLSNDFDPEDDPLTVVIASDPVHGSVNLEADGRVRYVPNAGFRGIDQFTYRVSDGQLLSGTATVTLVVANESPIGVVDSYQMPPDRVFQSGENGLLVNDIDPERDPLIAELVVEPAHGIVEISRDGSFTYRPNPGFEGSDAFCYRVRDPYSNSGPTRVDLSVVNARPVAHDDVFHARPDSPLLVSAIQGILANDFDADSDSLTPELRRVPAHGLVTIDADGGFFYRSANGFSGRDEFTYRLSDGRIASDEAVVVLYVTNGSPTALDDSYSLPHDRPFYVSPANGLLSNDTDPDQDFLSVNLIAGVSHGLLRLDATGGFDYRPDPGFVGDDYFTYRAIDGAAASETVGVTLHVGNIVPTAQSSKYTVAHGQPIRVPAPGLLAGAFDPDDDSLSVTILTPTAHGSLTVSENGAFEYRPDSTFTGVDRLVFRVSDGPSSSPPQTIEFNVSNRNPVARDDRFTIMHDRLAAGASYDVLTNDADPDEDPVTVSLLQGVGSAGDLHLDSTGKFTFSPSLHFVGAASFRYRISDGVSFDDADVTINFTNDAPVLSPDRYVVEANHSLSVAAIHGVCSNDRDPDEDPFTVQLVEGALHGAVTLSGDGSIVYVPTPDFVGIDEFSYRAMDGVVSAANAPVTRVRIHVVAQSQFAENDEYTTSHGRALVANVLDNDLVATGIPWSISLVQAPAFGIFELGAEGEFHYLPSADFSGDVTARYAIQQGGSTVFADMLFHVENSAPRGTRADYTILHGTRLMTTHATGLLALASDAEEDILSVSILSGPRYGDLHLNPDGSFDYFPRSSEFVGQDSFQYSLSDGVTTSVAQTATIHVIDSPPKSTPDRLSVHAGQLLSVAATGGVLANDYDTDLDSLVALVVDNPTHGALTLDRDGAFRYLPNPGFVGVDHWSYRVFDGALSTEPTSVDIRVENTGPLTENDDYSVLHGVTLCVGSSEGVISNDSDPDHDVLWASLVTSVPTGALDFQSDGAFTFYPPPGFAGVTTFTYKTTDGLTWSDPVTAVIHVTNMGPIARDDFRGTTVNHSAMISVVELLKNDSDGDHDPLTFTLSTAPSHGTVEVMPDGLAKYTPNPQFAGDDSFTYQITDGIVVSNRATVKITVRNSTPTANDDQFSIPHDQSLAVTAGRILQNDNDSDQTSLIAKIVANPNHGTLSFAQTGEFLYTPFPGYVGADSFLYQLSDGILNSPPAKVAITVENHSPKSPGQSYKVRHDQILTVSSTVGVLSKARDADSDPLRVELLASSNHGSLFIDTNGGFRYVPEAAFVGKDSFVYRVFDGIDYSSPISTLIEVENTVPTATVDQYALLTGGSLSVAAPGVLVNDRDFDHDSLTTSIVNGPLFGTATLQANGAFVYTPEAGFAGRDWFTYRLRDGASESIATVFIDTPGTPNSAPQPPRSAPDQFLTRRGQALVVNVTSGLLANDVDPNGDPLTASLVTGPNHGTISLAADGSFVYTPSAASSTGDDSFTYRVHDGSTYGNITVATITQRDADPWGMNAVTSIHHDSAITRGSLSGDVGDLDGDTLTFSLVHGPEYGSFSLASTGEWSYTPDQGFVGIDRFSWIVSDGISGSHIATRIIAVENERPLGTDATFSIQRGKTLNVFAGELLRGAIDPDLDSLSVAIVSGTAHGALSVTSSGAFSYTPSPGFAGDDQFVFAVTDGVARSVPLIAHISVENFTPVAHDAEFTTHLNTRLNTPTDRMSSRVVDIDADAVAFTRVSGPSHGTLTLEANGAFTYTPVAGFIGDDSFVYRASDGAATSSDAVVTLRVTNATPIAPDLDFLLGSPAEVRHASLVESALDPDGDPMSARISRQPDHGRVEFDANTGRFDYFPDVTFDGRDSFEYTVNDGGVNSNSGVVTIRSTNNPPRIDDQRYGVHHTTGSNSQATGFNVLRDAFDPDRDALTSTLVTAPKHGTVTLHPDGDFAYIPVPGFVGEDSFLVCATDTLGASTLATVTMVVTNRNPIPVADEFSAHHGQPLDISQAKLLSNDIDPDADPLSISIVSGPDQGTFRFDPVKRTYVFDPGNFVGETSFTYRVSDGASVSEPISATIRVENEVPHVWNTTLTLQSGDAHSGNLFVGSSAPRDVDGDPLTVQLVSGPSHGSLTLDPHGLYSYTPNAGFVGDDTFLVVVSDGVSRSEPFSVRCEVGGSSGFTVPDSVLGNIGYFPGTAIPLSVGAVPQISRPNSAPHAGGDGVYFVSRGKSVELSGILDNDSDPDGQPLSVVNPSVAGGGTLVNSADGLRFIAGSAVGSYSVRYQVSDGSLLSEPATIQVQVVNNAPNFADLFKSCDMNISATTGANSGFDYFGQDPDSDVTTVSFSQPMHGSLRTGRYQETGLTYAVYTPNPGYSGLDSYSATVSDGMLETTSRVTIFVIGSDHSTAQAPLVATDDTLEWTGLALHGNVLTNDGCLNGVLVTTPFQGNGLDLRSDGTFTFDLAGSPSADVADFVRNGRTFDYTIHNAAGKTATAHLRLTAREIRPGEYYSDPNTGTTVENLVSTGNSRGRFKAFVDNGKVHIQPTVGASFSIKVETPGAAALPVAWDEAAGSIPSLYLTTDGAIEGNLSADTLFLSAGGSVGNVSGATIRVSAGGDLGALQASKYVLTASAGGDIASISAGQCLIDATAGGRIGPVSSGGYIGSIRTGGNGPLSVLAISNIERVTAGGDISLISSAAGSIGVVTAGRDVVSPILAGGFIGTVTAQRDIHSTITAGGPVFRVGTTLGDISGSITSSQNIAAISAGRDLLANVSARNVVGITAGGSVSGDLAATGNLGRISANRAITGRVRAGENIGTVTGATGISSFEISAGGNIGAIETTVRNAAVHSALISAGNRIGAIRAAGSVEAAISAGTSIAVIAAGTAGTGDIRSTSIVAGTSIGTISALTGSIAADLTAARSIGEITAADDIDGHIHSGILSGLSALHGSISGTLTADESLGDVKAGSILSSVIHSFGNIGRIAAGVWDGGSISGDITAVGTIERIDAYCQTPGVAPANLELTEFSFQDHWNQKLAEISGQKQTTQPAVVAPSISTSAVVGGGDILSKIIAGGSIGAVAADGMIRDSIEAAKRIPIVAAGLDILGAITSDFGQTTIITLGRLIGGVISRGNVRAYSYKDLTSTMSSTEGSIKATSYGSITNARLTAFMNIYASSPFEFTGMASAQHGVAELCSMGDLGVNVFAEKDIIAAGEDLKNCRFTSAAGNVVAALTHAAALETRAAGTVLVTAISDIESAKIQGEYVSVYSLGSIRGTIAATTNIDVEIIGTANLNAASLHGNITVIAAGVKGTYATSGTENELGGRAGDIDLVAMGRGLYGDRSGGDLSAIVDAARNFHASALGEISGRADVKGRAEVSAFGDLTMKFTLATVMKPHELSSWQNVNADVVSGGAVDVFALNDCGGRITVHTNHDGSQPFEGNVNVVSYGWLSAEIESTDDVSVSGFQGIVSASIRAGDDIEAHSAGIVSTNMSAGDSKLLPDDQQRTSDSKENTLFVMSLGETTGKLSGANGVVVASHGGISSDISSTHGDVAVKALVSLGGGATDFSGNIDARKGSVVVKSSGNVTSPRIRGGDSVQIAAHNSISNCEITAMDGDVELNSDGSISNVKVAKAKDVALSAIKSIEAKVSAQGDAMLESRGRIKAAVETSAGSISVTSLGDVESDGTGFIAENDVTVTAFGEFRSARVVAKTGNATVFSREGLTNATISGTSGVDVASHQNVSNSTLTAASGVAFLSSLGGVTQTAVTGNYGASITSTRQIRAIINSDAGFASAVSSGDFLISDVDVRMTGAFGVAATSLAGAVSGTFNSSQGGARVTAAGTFKGTISAADGISVDAVESITIETVQDPAGPSPLSVSLGNTATQSNPSQGTATTPPVAAPPPTVNTRGDVSLSSFESITGTISAGGNIDAFAGGGLTGVITGRNVSAISRTGQVAATVTATGSAFVSALTRVTSSVTAGDDITVAALEAIEGNVTSQAGTATVESLLGSVTGAIQAGRDVNLFSFGSTPSSISAGRDANVKSMAAVIGTILAGRSATVEATGGIAESVTAGGDIEVDTLGQVSAPLSAGQDVDVVAWGGIESHISAGGNANVFSGGVTKGLVSAGEDADVFASGFLQIVINAAGDVSAMGGAALSVTATGGGNVDVTGRTTAMVDIHAGNWAQAFGLEKLQGFVVGGNFASASSLGILHADVTGGQDVTAFAVDAALGHYSGGQTASLISFGPAVDVLVEGAQDASLLAIGDIVGEVRSSAGSASAISFGTSVSRVTAATDALSVAVGDLIGSVTAGDFAGAIALGNIYATIRSGADALLLAQGAIGSGLNAGGDAAILALGGITGQYVVGGSAAAVSLGGFNAGLIAGWDVSLVEAKGNISGNIVAGNNVARVFSYGSINASVSARNDSGSSQGGRIGQVDALGDISGSIHAKQLLAEVRAGGVINASLDAPSLGNISSHDATIAAQNPVPDTPPSSTASVVAQAMEARRDVVAARDELRDLLTEAFTAIEAARTDAASAASRERSGMVIEARRLRAEATEQLIGDRSAREFSLAAQRIQAAFADLQGAAAADRLRAVLATTWKMRESAGDEAFRRSRDEATRFQAKETEARDKMRQSATEARDKFRESADEFQDVMKAVIKGIKEKIAAAVDIPAMFSGMSEGMKKSIHETEALADELGYRDEERGDFIVSNLIVQWFPGLRKIYAGMWGEDPYTLTKLTRFQQIFSFVTGVLDAIEFIETVYAAGKMLYSRFTSPCGSWFGGTCFVGDTLVLCGTDVASDLYFASDTESFWDRVIPLPDWLQFACVTIGGAGVVVLTRRGRREEIREQDEFSPNNGGAGEAPFEEWDPNICPPPRRKSPVPGQDSGSRVWTTGSIILLGRSLENAGPPMQNASMSTSQPPLGVDFATCGRAAHFQTVQGENAWGDWSSAARAVCGVLDSGEAGGFVGELIPLQTDHSDFSPTGFGGTCDSTSGGVELPRLPIPRSETIGLRRPTRRPGQSVYWSDTPLEIEAIGGLPLADKGTGESPTGGAVLRPSRMEASDRHFPASKSRTSGIETPAREPEREGEAPAEPLMRQHQLMDADFNQPPQCVSRRGGTESLTNVVMTAVGETHCGCHTASGNRPNQNHPNHRRSTPGDQPSHPWWLGAPFVWLTVWLSLATIVWGFNHDLREMTRSRPTPMPVAYSSSGPAIIDPIPTADSSTLRLSLASSTNRPADHFETVTAQNGRRYRARRIRDIQTGHRVLARNPQVDSNSLTDADIDPADWVNVRMRLEKPDGGVLNVVLLRPVDWLADRLELWNTFPESDRLDRSASADHGQIPYLPELGDSNESSQQQQVAALHVEVDRPFLTIEQRQATVADALPALAIPEGPASDRLPRERLWIHLDLPEIGAVGRAELVSLEPCPPIEPGQGRIVTGTFAHSSAEVIDIEITGVEEPIGCTANHPFWSEDRQDFVQAGTLRIGENLRSESGTLLQVTRITPRTGPPVEVFNLEVDAEHVYYVSAGGVLVHNAYDIDESLRQLGMGTSSTSSAPSRVYTIYVNGSFHKFGVTDAAGKRLREVVRSLGDVEIAISVSKEMPKYRAHMIEKYLRSLHFNSTGQWHLPGMKYPFPVDFSTGLPIPPPATHFR